MSSFGGTEQRGDITKEYFPIPRKFISKHIKMHLSRHHTELFWKSPWFGKIQGKNIFRPVAWHNETAGWQMSFYSLWCLNIRRTSATMFLSPKVALSQSDIMLLLFPMSTCYSDKAQMYSSSVRNRFGVKSAGWAVYLSSCTFSAVLGKHLKFSWLQCPCVRNRKHNGHGSKEMEADVSLVFRCSSGLRTYI